MRILFKKLLFFSVFFSFFYLAEGNCLNLKEPDQLVFCTGAPRSGTTVTYSLLCSQETYPMFPECTFITPMFDLYHRISRFSDKERFEHYFKNQDNLKEMFVSFINRMIVSLIDNWPRKKTLVLKDPELICHINDAFFELFPKAKVVIVIREPKDIIASLIKVKKRYRTFVSLEDTVNYLLKYTSSIKEVSSKYCENVIVVKYEDIVNKKRKVFLDIEKTLGYKINKESFQHISYDINSAHIKKDPTHSALYGQKLSKISVGNYRKELTKEEIDYIDKAFNEFNEYYGYTDLKNLDIKK